MRVLRSCLLIAGVSLFSLSARAQTQTDLNAAAYARYQKADQRLNQVYQTILKQYSRDGLFIQNLKKAQRLWLQLRDADLQARYPAYNGSGHYGSMQPMCEAEERTALTEARIRQLQIWTTGIPEGDGCMGSVKYAPEPKQK